VRVVWLVGGDQWDASKVPLLLVWSTCHTHLCTEVLGTTDRTSSCSVVSSRVGLHAQRTVYVCCCDCNQGLCPEVFDRSNLCRESTSSSGSSWFVYWFPFSLWERFLNSNQAVICSCVNVCKRTSVSLCLSWLVCWSCSRFVFVFVLFSGICEWCGCDVLLADTSRVAICCVQLVTLRQDYNVKYHDTQWNTVCCIRCGCITRILVRESMMCDLDTCDVRNCCACTCAVQIGWNACILVCEYRGTQRDVSVRM